MSRDDHWIAPLHRAERFVTVSRLTCERTCDHECHYDPDMNPESCDGCTGMGEQERVATPRQTAADAADADTPEPLTAALVHLDAATTFTDDEEVAYYIAQARTEIQRATLDAARAVPEPSGPHPDKPHEFRTVCDLCGEFGWLHVSLLTNGEVVRVERSDEGMG